MASSTAVKPEKGPRGVSFKSVALPAEHGSWSLVSEPILLGMLIAPSWAGLAMAAAAFATFLLSRPAKLYLADRRRGRSYQRTLVARKFTFIYGAIALVAAALTVALAGARPFMPFLLAAPLLAVFVYYDWRPGRSWQAEVAAPAAFGAVVSSIALIGGYSWQVALALWAFMIARSVPAVLFVRARLRLDKGKAGELWSTLVSHLAAVGLVAALVIAGGLPLMALVAAVFLLARALWGISPYRWRSSAMVLGVWETACGLIAVLLVAIGFWLA